MVDPPGAVRGIVTEDAIRKESDRVDEIGAGRPMKDELEIMGFVPKDRIDPGTVTSDEGSKLPGTRRPKKGEGWRGHGHTMLSLRKGIPKPFCDGAGLCSPGRWPKKRRNLPETNVAKALQNVLIGALLAAEKTMPGGSCKAVLHSIISGNH